MTLALEQPHNPLPEIGTAKVLTGFFDLELIDEYVAESANPAMKHFEPNGDRPNVDEYIQRALNTGCTATAYITDTLHTMSEEVAAHPLPYIFRALIKNMPYEPLHRDEQLQTMRFLVVCDGNVDYTYATGDTYRSPLIRKVASLAGRTAFKGDVLCLNNLSTKVKNNPLHSAQNGRGCTRVVYDFTPDKIVPRNNVE